MFDLSPLTITLHETLRGAMECINRNGKGIAMVLADDGRLASTITDGDLRRAILHGLSLNTTIEQWTHQQVEAGNKHPLVMPLGTPDEVLLRRMKEAHIRQIPLVNNRGQVVGLACLGDLVAEQALGVSAVIMAGGRGTRLRPLTFDMPKPMLPVGGRPVLERIIEGLYKTGVRRVNITTHYMPEKIVDHFGNGQRFGVELNYVNEARPLGTAGALGLMPPPNEPLLVINGDVLSDIDYRALLAYHQEHEADLTVAVRRHEISVPFGVVQCAGPQVVGLQEKPDVAFLVNSGIYLLEPSVYDYMPHGEPFGMTDLIQRLLGAGRKVVGFAVPEYWLDIGRHEDYARAERDLFDRSAA